MRLNLNPAAGCGSLMKAGFTQRPVALDLTEATEGLEAAGESKASFFLAEKNPKALRQFSGSSQPGRHLGAGHHRNRKRSNNRARVGCASRPLTA